MPAYSSQEHMSVVRLNEIKWFIDIEHSDVDAWL